MSGLTKSKAGRYKWLLFSLFMPKCCILHTQLCFFVPFAARIYTKSQQAIWSDSPQATQPQSPFTKMPFGTRVDISMCEAWEFKFLFYNGREKKFVLEFDGTKTEKNGLWFAQAKARKRQALFLFFLVMRWIAETLKHTNSSDIYTLICTYIYIYIIYFRDCYVSVTIHTALAFLELA